jgi:hypothetical protein
MNLFTTTIECIDASLNSAPEMANESDLVTFFAEKIQAFRKKYGIQEDEVFGNAEVWGKKGTRKMLDELTQMEYEIMLYAWKHIKSLMLDCGAGDVVREVLASSLFDIPTSWDRKEKKGPQ